MERLVGVRRLTVILDVAATHSPMIQAMKMMCMNYELTISL
jgi:hypothetical protein